MPMVHCLPTSNSNRGWCYARAEYRDDRGRRRVLVWQVSQRSRGTSGAIALREDRGAEDLPGTRKSMSGDELQRFLIDLEANGRVTFAGDEIAFPERFLVPFLDRCRARIEDARRGALSTTPAMD